MESSPSLLTDWQYVLESHQWVKYNWLTRFLVPGNKTPFKSVLLFNNNYNNLFANYMVLDIFI